MGKRPQLYELWVMQDINCLHFIHYDALIMSLLFFEIVQNAIEWRFEFRTLFKKVLQSSSRYFEIGYISKYYVIPGWYFFVCLEGQAEKKVDNLIIYLLI